MCSLEKLHLGITIIIIINIAYAHTTCHKTFFNPLVIFDLKQTVGREGDKRRPTYTPKEHQGARYALHYTLRLQPTTLNTNRPTNTM